MRSHIVIAAALALSATTAYAAPRSLSAPQSNPVQTESPKPVADAPVYKIQSSDEATPAPQPKSAPEPAPAPVQAAPQPAPAPAPVQAAPAAAPSDAGAARTVETAPAAEAKPAVAPKRTKHAQRRTKRQPETVEQRVNRDLRAIDRKIGSIGLAGAMGAATALSVLPYAIPSVVYW